MNKMNCRVFMIWFLILIITPFATFSSERFSDSMSLSSYQLNAGDLIKVTVFGEEDMSIETRLSDAGTISYPFLGEIKVRGMTIGELESFVVTHLKKEYLLNPKVNISILEYRKFFVNGEVKNPGGFSFEPGLTMEKAITLAGGFTERAKRKDILVTRDEEGYSKEFVLSLNSKILPGDIITVRESFF